MKSCFLAVDKPPGVTSHDVVAIFRSVTGAKKVGHTGTLDPFATGALALAFGTATRLISFLDEDLKVYDATIALGTSTDTGDPTGQVVRELPVPALDEATVDAVLAEFKGVRMQAPPRYSAVKVRGRALYSYAREGLDVEAAPRPIRIDSITLIEMSEASLRVRITCGRGTYARVLADEIAVALGTTGHLSALRRERTGPFVESKALTLPQLGKIVGGSEDWRAVLRPNRGPDRVRWAPRDEVIAALEPYCVRPVDALSHLPVVPLLGGERQRLLAGGPLPVPPTFIPVGSSYLLMEGDAVIAVAVREPAGPRLARVVVET